MSMKIGALVIDLQGIELTTEERELLQHPLVGGVILFSRNYSDVPTLQALCRSIRACRDKPILIMVDQEGGRVQRFRDFFYPLPSLGWIGEWYDRDPKIALELAKTHAWIMATEVITAGIDLSLAPVIDVAKGHSNVIGNRAFHRDTKVLAWLAKAYCEGMQEAGMMSVLKHFPGHGHVSADSHTEIPVDNRDLASIETEDLAPFRDLIQAGAHAIMAAHIIFPAVDNLPVSLSRIWLQDVLRNKLKFNGVILSDDLNMQGASTITDCADRVKAAREAGCDIALLCNNREAVIRTLDKLPHAAHQLPETKWRVLQANFTLDETANERMVRSKHFLQSHTETSTLTTREA